MSTIHAHNETVLFPTVSLADGRDEVIAMQKRDCRNGNVCYSFSLDSIPSAERMALAVSSALIQGAKQGYDVKVGKDHRFIFDQHGKKILVNLQVVYWNKRQAEVAENSEGQMKP